MTAPTNGHIEEVVTPPAPPKLNRRQRRAARQQAKAAEAAPDAPKSPALYTPEWYALQITALDADMQQKFALWQQAVGRLDAVRQMQALDAAQAAQEDGK